MARLYLASISPRRKEILKRLGIRFTVLTPKLIEDSAPTFNSARLGSIISPARYAIQLAKMKVDSVKHRITKGIILGMDTIVVLDKKILGKPKNQKSARQMLKMLSGKTHRVITGIYLLHLPNGNSCAGYETTKVKFRKLTKLEINQYIKTQEPYDKAGGYGIQGKAGLFIESINGCYSNVVGFPVTKFLKLLKKLNSHS